MPEFTIITPGSPVPLGSTPMTFPGGESTGGESLVSGTVIRVATTDSVVNALYTADAVIR